MTGERDDRHGVDLGVVLVLPVAVAVVLATAPTGVVADRPAPTGVVTDARATTAADAAVTVDAPETVPPGETVTVQVTLRNDGAEPAGYVLELGGTRWSVVDHADDSGVWKLQNRSWLYREVDPGDEVSPTVTFRVPSDATGQVDLQVTAETASGVVDETAATLSVDRPPEAALSVPRSVTAGESVTLDATASRDPDPGEAVDRYEWDLDGDGTVEQTTTDPTVETAYEEPDAYTPTVTVVAGDATATASATVTVDSSQAAPTGTRSLPDAVRPGETATVTVTVPVDGEVTGLAVAESVDGLSVVDWSASPSATYRETERQWLFLSVADRTATVEYTVRVPASATAGTRYQFDGEVSATDRAVTAVEGDTTLVVRRCPASAAAGEDDRLDLREVQQAVGAWADGEPVAGETLSLRTIQRLVGLWADGEDVTCGGESQ